MPVVGYYSHIRTDIKRDRAVAAKHRCMRHITGPTNAVSEVLDRVCLFGMLRIYHIPGLSIIILTGKQGLPTKAHTFYTLACLKQYANTPHCLVQHLSN